LGEKHYKYEDFVCAIARRLQELRIERGYSKRRFAMEHGYFLSHWHKIESGEKMSLHTLLRVCNSFDMTLAELVESAVRHDGPGVGSKGYKPEEAEEVVVDVDPDSDGI
jgi:transcriptional regulator with XRE-family HTH domain